MHSVLLGTKILAVLVLAAFSSSSQPSYSQPPVSAYGEQPEISLVALSDSGNKIAMVVKSTEKLTAEVAIETEGRIPPKLRKRINRFAESGHDFYPTKFVIHDRETGETRSQFLDHAYSDRQTVTDIDFIGENFLLISVLSGTGEINRRGKIETLGHSSRLKLMNIHSMTMSDFIFEHEIDEAPQDRRTVGVVGLVAQAEMENVVYLASRGHGGECKTNGLHLVRGNLDTVTVELERCGTRNTIDWFVKAEDGAIVREEFDDKRNFYRISSLHDGTTESRYEVTQTPRPPLALVGSHPHSNSLVILDAHEFDFLSTLNEQGEISSPFAGQQNKDIDRVFVDRSRTVQGVVFSGVTSSFWFFDEALTIDLNNLVGELAGSGIELVDHSVDWQKLLLKIEGGFTSGMYVLHDRETGTRELIAEVRPEVSENDLGEVLAFNFAARDGLEIESIVTLPPGVDLATVSNLKTIVMPHGGPEAYDRIGFDWMAQFFANRGYLVLQPNFRGSAGYGTSFVAEGNGEWGGKMQDDITDALYALMESGLVDRDRICIVGASYGGYAALAGGAFTPDLYKCIIAVAPVTDLNRMLKDEKRAFGRDHWVVDYWEERMADGEARQRKLRAISPAKHAERFQAPVLLIHGDRDTVVPIVQSEIMHKALKRADKEVEFIEIEGADHWLTQSNPRLQTLESVAEFVARHLKDYGSLETDR